MATHQQHSADKPKEVAKQRPKAEPASQEPVVLPELPVSSLLQRAVTRPRQTMPGSVQALQRAFGNRAVTSLLPQTSPRLPIQAKLTVNPGGDQYEQEADRVATQVMSMPEQAPKVQRMGEEEEDEGKRLLAHELVHAVQQGAAEGKGAQPVTSLPPSHQSLQCAPKDPLMGAFGEQNRMLSLFLSGLIPLRALGLDYISDDLKKALIKKGLATEEEIDEHNAHAAGNSSSSSSSSSSSAAAPGVSDVSAESVSLP